MAISNSEGHSVAKDGRKKKKSGLANWKASPRKWRTEMEQNAYSTKLLDALRRFRRPAPAAEAPPRSRDIREAADQVLAVAARGQTRWSRAILSSRKIKLKARRPRPATPASSLFWKIRAAAVGAHSMPKKKAAVLEGKAAVLGHLVPGGRKLSFPTLLEEASDYIAALEMQVRSMSNLTAILSAPGGNQLSESDRSAA
ncbi:hypothetical protein HPP92_013514 [Vanilla planifolia]|uniref:IBH1-like N-terminal domain-containing protein n=1 Tax=Vanilla planifolia TaxID=51239 RepID=A0A835QYE2_VANPL|nr:hypothetical protein HPP92_013514 [Vanilla planifolia]